MSPEAAPDTASPGLGSAEGAEAPRGSRSLGRNFHLVNAVAGARVPSSLPSTSLTQPQDTGFTPVC